MTRDSITLTTDTSAFMRGMEISDHHGNTWIVIGVHRTYVGVKRSTWWRRLYWRVRIALRRLLS